jgi:adenylosuccinate synthase
VGSGPFPTELNDETGDLLRRAGNEFGSVTGRPRRCGWLDLVALRYTIMLSGVTQLIMTKSDVMDSFESIKVCTAYKIDGKLHEDLPFDLENCTIEPQYTELPGWKTVTANLTSESQFPKEFSAYISFLEERLQTPIRIISLGPDRRQTVLR